jgi:hypothetical protein
VSKIVYNKPMAINIPVPNTRGLKGVKIIEILIESR